MLDFINNTCFKRTFSTLSHKNSMKLSFGLFRYNLGYKLCYNDYLFSALSGCVMKRGLKARNVKNVESCFYTLKLYLMRSPFVVWAFLISDFVKRSLFFRKLYTTFKSASSFFYLSKKRFNGRLHPSSNKDVLKIWMPDFIRLKSSKRLRKWKKWANRRFKKIIYTFRHSMSLQLGFGSLHKFSVLSALCLFKSTFLRNEVCYVGPNFRSSNECQFTLNNVQLGLCYPVHTPFNRHRSGNILKTVLNDVAHFDPLLFLRFKNKSCSSSVRYYHLNVFTQPLFNKGVVYFFKKNFVSSPPKNVFADSSNNVHNRRWLTKHNKHVANGRVRYSDIRDVLPNLSSYYLIGDSSDKPDSNTVTDNFGIDSDEFFKNYKFELFVFKLYLNVGPFSSVSDVLNVFNKLYPFKVINRRGFSRYKVNREAMYRSVVVPQFTVVNELIRFIKPRLHSSDSFKSFSTILCANMIDLLNGNHSFFSDQVYQDSFVKQQISFLKHYRW